MVNKTAVFGISHKISPIEDWERISFDEGRAREALAALASKPAVGECVTVATCNRVEIYVAYQSGEKCFDEISDFLCELNRRIRRDFIEENFYFLEGSDCVRHLYRVAAGMDSMVVGEPQILAQLKRAYETARSENTVGPALNRLFQSAFSAAKKIKSKTGIGSHALSVSSVAAGLAKNIFGEIENCSALVIGTGQAASEAAFHLAKRGAAEITIAGRNREHAAKLASALGAKSAGIGEINSLLARADIVISATASPDYVIKSSDVRDTMKLRNNGPISFIDIAVPRDVAPEARDIEGVFLYDMNDLQKIVKKNYNRLDKSLKVAEEVIKDCAENFALWQMGAKAFPVIVEMKKRASEIAETETLKAIAKLEALEKSGGCNAEKRGEILRALSRSITGKILHKPITKLKREAANSPSAQSAFVETVRSLFDLTETNTEKLARKAEPPNFSKIGLTSQNKIMKNFSKTGLTSQNKIIKIVAKEK